MVRPKLNEIVLFAILILVFAGFMAKIFDLYKRQEATEPPTRTVELSPDRQMLEIVLYDGDEAVEYLTVTYEGGGLCVASSVRVEGADD